MTKKLPAFTINDKLILEPYKGLGEGLKPEIRQGLAFARQKVNLVGLKVLVEARLNDGSYIPAGSIAYIAEDVFFLPTSKWAKEIRQCPSVLGEQEFILVDKTNIVMIDTGEDISLSS